jgi:hypothetical protein
MKQSYGLDKKQAAVKALERGENLTKVSHQFQVISRISDYNNHMFEYKVLIRIFGTRREEVTLGWRKWYDEDLLNFSLHKEY